MRTLCKKALALCVVFALALTCFVGTLSVSAADVSFNANVSVNASPVAFGDTTAEAVIHITLAESGICEALIKVASPIGSVAKEVELVKDINGTPFDDEIVDETTGLTEFEALDYKVDYSGESSDFGAFFLSTKEYEKDDITEAFIKVTFTIGSDIEAGTYAVNIDTPEGKVIAASKSEDIINLIYDSEANPFIVTCEHEYGETVEVTAPTCTAAGAGTQTCSICKDVKDVEIPATGKHAYEYEIGDGKTHSFTCTVGGETGSEPCAPGEDGVTCVCGYVFVTEPETFTVTFVDADGSTVLGTDEVEAGAAATAPEVADDVDNNKYFTGWNKDFSNITEDTTVTAKYANLNFRIQSRGLILKGEILIYYAFNDAGNTKLTDAVVEEWGILKWEEPDYNKDSISYADALANGKVIKYDAEESGGNLEVYLPRYSFEVNDIAYTRPYAKLTNGTIIYGKSTNGSYQSPNKYSVTDYCISKKGTSGYLHDLICSLLNYGTAAQINWNHNTDRLANVTAGLTDAELAIGSEEVDFSNVISIGNQTDGVETTVNNSRINAPSLTLDSKVVVNFKSDLNAETKEIKKVALLSWNEEDYLAAKENGGANISDPNVHYEECTALGNGIYDGKSFGIYAYQIKQTIYGRVYIEYADGTVGYTRVCRYSAEYYAKQGINSTDTVNYPKKTKDLLVQMMNYGKYALLYENNK